MPAPSGRTLIVAFGSQVGGHPHALSDLDIAVLPHDPQVTMKALLGISRALSEVLHREVDLSFIHQADPLLLHHICRSPRLLFGSLRRLHELRMYAFHRHQDYQPYFALEAKCVKREILRFAHAH
jgi:predicted nucleotidyltransferase